MEEIYDKERERKEKKVCDNIKVDSKAFFTYANSFRKSKTRIGPLKSGGSYWSGEKEMANILSRQYESVFTTPYDTPFVFNPRDCQIIEDIEITPVLVKEAMKRMKVSSAPGPDGIIAYIFHTFADELCDPISQIWRRSLDTSLMPEGPITATITPIFKDGDRSDAANYRPVSLTNHLTKVFERVMRKQLVHHLESQNLMNITQHGFREGRSTLSQLLSYYDSILSMLEENHQVHSVYLDFSKAFDKVDHKILLTKVEGMGIQGKILKWLHTFLTTRTQRVKVGNQLSDEVKVRSGVPQGSVLGPLLFLIYMIDIGEDVKNSLLGSFADDTRAWKAVTCTQDFQDDLNMLYGWAVDNNGEFNGKKFDLMAYNDDSESRPYTQPDGTPIRLKKHVKDLGVYMSDDCTFNFHINSVIKKAQQKAAWVLEKRARC